MRYFMVVMLSIGTIILSSCITPSPSIKKRTVLHDSRTTMASRLQYGKRAKTGVFFTFLDTINSANELRLFDDDFQKNGQTSLSALSDTPLPKSLYRIQVFASNRIESVRKQKKELERSTNQPVMIDYDAPYYKLYAGGFEKKRDAQSVLLKLKRIGYVDAWIVTTRVNP